MITCSCAKGATTKGMHWAVCMLCVLATLAAVSRAGHPVTTQPQDTDAEPLGPPEHRQTERHAQYHIVAVHIPDSKSVDVEHVARANGFTLMSQMANLDDYYLFRRDIARRDEPHGLDRAPEIKWMEEQIPRERVTREATWEWPLQGNPLLEYQWTLVNPSELPAEYRQHNSVGSPLNINVAAAWKAGYTGKGVVVAIVDDGLEHRHPDLQDNYSAEHSYDFNDLDSDPTPGNADSHGTSCTGLVGAVNNAAQTPACGVGVAYDASVAGIRLLGAWTTDADEANALGHHCRGSSDSISIYTNSWGPSDSGRQPAGPGRMTKETIFNCAENGRGGLGSIYVWAGGNGAGNGDNVAWDRYASDMHTIAVGAIDDNGEKAWYSEPGSALFCSVPSSGGNRGVATTDLVGHRGSSYSDCTRTFGGTSAAAPQVAGVVALMLQANPSLSWRDVQHIIAESCAPVGIDTETHAHHWHRNAAGYSHSHLFGFGLVDAAVAVDRAISWANVPAERAQITSGSTQENRYVYYNKIETFTVRASEAGIPNAQFLEHVEVHIKADTPNGHGYMALQLCSPTDTCSTLVTSGPGHQSSIDWTFMTVRHWGEDVVNREVLSNARAMARNALDAQATDPREWRLHVWNTATQRSAPIYFKSWKLDWYGFEK